MSQTAKNALAGLGSGANIAMKKATAMRLGSQLRSAKQTIGKSAYEQGIDCGPASQTAVEAHAALEEANHRMAAANEAGKASTQVQARAVAIKDKGMAKAAQTAAAAKVRSAYEAMGGHILAQGIHVPGLDDQIAAAQALRQQIETLNTEVASLGQGLLTNKVGLAAVACVVLVVAGTGFFAVSSFLGGDNRSELERQLDDMQDTLRTVRERTPQQGPQTGSGWAGSSEPSPRRGSGWTDPNGPNAWNDPAAREAFIRDSQALQSRGNGQTVGSPGQGRVRIEGKGDDYQSEATFNPDGGYSASVHGEGFSGRSEMKADGSGYGEYDINGQKLRVDLDSEGGVRVKSDGGTYEFPKP